MHRPSFSRLPLALALGTSLAILAVMTGRSEGQDPSGQATKTKGKVDSQINKQFHKANPRDFAKRFESEKRENYALRHEIVASLELKPGMGVADVGAGTGFFTRLFAEKVGPSGKVYAVDISKPFLKHIAEDAKKNHLDQIETVLGSQDATNLPENSVDVVFLSDVYHHFEKPEKSLASIHRALRPGGKLVVIEFDRVEGRSSAFILKHVRASQAVFRREIEDAGFRFLPTPNPPKLKENFFLRFEKAATGGGRASK
ncbi:MAG: class I SAM-dependent methyltransferase [Isosphaeraceae bacterium]